MGKEGNIRRRNRRASEGAPDWLVTYGDLQTLLFVFFISLISLVEPLDSIFWGFSRRPQDTTHEQPNEDSDAQYNEGEGAASGQYEVEAETPSPLFTGVNQQKAEANLSLSDVNANVLLSQLQGLSFERSDLLQVDIQARGIIISLSAQVFFDKGSAQVRLDKVPYLLRDLAFILNHPSLAKNRVRVEGHAGEIDLGIYSDYHSNWELGAMRAINVLGVLVGYGVNEENYSIASYSGYGGGGQLRETLPSFSRRVDIVLERDIIDT